ncbi:hypothetical protein CH25_gp65 [Mycobacterium phage EagleEye]|uniref:Uncharacterized protein n=1 Tax=Mycobacterium phage EagleEye TaxID=1429759 RepID=W0LJ59_9CAUD|nr:hypothetical protein CH25_gp65 [Mycobacterium phage EagleEye]AHG23821.1 hypothetical protein PBI_EAGLEEYE_41 [Mycobacterium phage EagleEye]
MTRYVVTARMMFSNREDALKAASMIDGHEYYIGNTDPVTFDGVMSTEVVVDEV